MKNASRTNQQVRSRSEEFVRLPGLFRRWEFEQVLKVGDEFFIDDAGRSADGTDLFVIYMRESPEAR